EEEEEDDDDLADILTIQGHNVLKSYVALNGLQLQLQLEEEVIGDCTGVI
ncbi:7245_t:CDS:1, partial [Gigaspora rosea]